MISGVEIAKSFGLTKTQSQAVELRQQDLAVTAGAGSGKTLTLVARYLSLLAEGMSPRQVVAITFTEKAAREMRNRVRSQLARLAVETEAPAERSLWESLSVQMDSARIGTIHSLCAELLRAYPAELGIDPRFEVLDEGQAATLQVQVVQDTLAWVVGQDSMAILFDCLTIRGLEELLAYLLGRRLDAAELLAVEPDPSRLIGEALRQALRHPDIAGPLEGLALLQADGELSGDAGPSLADQIKALLAIWSAGEASLAQGDWLACAQALYQARREQMSLRSGRKDSRAKAMLAELRAAYDEWLDPWLGGSKASTPGPSPDLEQIYARAMPAVRELFRYSVDRYQAGLAQRRVLDFDDLEAGAAALLEIETVRSAWQNEVEALLVDEFQDTNRRQRAIVTALSNKPGEQGRLFVVGDARQSIYRFRGADVRVFRNLQAEIARAGGQVINLDLTFRAHARLLAITEELLAKIMGTQSEAGKPYKIPFSSLTANRQAASPQYEEPYLEFIIGLGEDAAAGRQSAAQALANHLVALKQAGQIDNWQEVCLLFRASTAFQVYEQAFEASGIPFVTVAGRGFYDRPEIRDLLNMLQALADPWDDLALAGVLRSPAFGLSDAALYRLRWSEDQPRELWSALELERDRAALEPEEHNLAGHAWATLSALRPQVDRLPVAEVLKQLIDATDYRAVLAAAESPRQDNGRLWRNLDKLLEDATVSRLVSVRAFLEYLATLKDAGAREGEAPVEAENAQGGAVRLMTVHKAKGLEFNLVVIADAGRSGRNSADPVYLMAETGLAARLDNQEGDSLVYRLARWMDAQQADAEEQRLLYVAATRAREKLLINGHLTAGRQRLRASGWLGQLLEAVGIDLDALQPDGDEQIASTPENRPFGIQVIRQVEAVPYLTSDYQAAEQTDTPLAPLYPAIPFVSVSDDETDEPDLPDHPAWRSTQGRSDPAAEVVGRMVHRALQRWLFPDDPGLEIAPGKPGGSERLERRPPENRLPEKSPPVAETFAIAPALEGGHSG